MKKSTAQAGLIAWRMTGTSMICRRPKNPMARNQTSMMGLNTSAMRSVPTRCHRNRPMMMMIAMGRMKCFISTEIVSSPSTAEMTEIAGVITPSP